MENKIFGGTLKSLRVSAGKTVNDVSSHLISLSYKASEKTIYSWEAGRSQPTPDALLDLCKYYGVTDVLSAFGIDASAKKNAPSMSDEAKKVGERYEVLDSHGKAVINVVMTEEERRMEQERKKARSKKHDGLYAEEDEYPRVIPLYYTPAAAGYAQPVFETDFEYIDVGGDVPVYADFAVQIDGDSMEPYIMDGATVYVNRNPLANGDVGIFFCDGDMLCKQYYRDPRGVVWLLSLNRERKDADRRIPVDTGMNLVCYGRVILPVKPNLAVPEEDLK